MRIALIGVSHWHAPMYYRPLAKLPGRSIVGVSDPVPAALRRAQDELGTPGYADYRELVEAEKPDFAFVFGRHCDMAASAAWLIERGVPFIVEKPAGLNASAVASLRDRAAARGLHVGTGFSLRVGDFAREVLALAREEPVTWASFRFIAGSPDRYAKDGCAWMLDPALSGGGSTINLSVHFFDLFRLFTGGPAAEVSALMGNHTFGLPIEDYSSVSLRSPSAACNVQTGYTLLGPSGGWDISYCVRTTKHYVVARSDNVIEIRGADGGLREIRTASVGNGYWYPAFVRESLERFERGEPPVAGLDDLVAAMKVVDAAYASSRSAGARAAAN